MALSSVLHTQNPAPLQLNAVGAVGAGGTTCRALLCATSPYKSKCQQADPSVVVGRRRGRHRWRVHPTEAPLFLAPVLLTWHTHPPTHPPTHTHTHPSNPGGKQAGGNVVLGSRSRIILIGAGNGHCRIFLIFVVIVAQGLYICGDASTPVLIEEFDAGWVGSIYGIPCLQLIEAFAHQVQRIRFGE